ncbi:MAG: hypothetical protein OHK0017_07950 [Patescibacteria group bacterium]
MKKNNAKKKQSRKAVATKLPKSDVSILANSDNNLTKNNKKPSKSDKISQKITDLLQKDPVFLQLHIKWQIYVQRYLQTKNGTESAITAGYSENSAEVQSSRLLKNANIKSLIEKYIKLEAEMANDTMEELIEMLYEIARDPFSTPSARVSAIKQIAELRGLNSKGLLPPGETPPGDDAEQTTNRKFVIKFK